MVLYSVKILWFQIEYLSFIKYYLKYYRFLDMYETKCKKKLNVIVHHFLYYVFSKIAGSWSPDFVKLSSFMDIFEQKKLKCGTAFLQESFSAKHLLWMLLTFDLCFHVGKTECLEKRAFLLDLKDIIYFLFSFSSFFFIFLYFV